VRDVRYVPTLRRLAPRYVYVSDKITITAAGTGNFARMFARNCTDRERNSDFFENRDRARAIFLESIIDSRDN